MVASLFIDIFFLVLFDSLIKTSENLFGGMFMQFFFSTNDFDFFILDFSHCYYWLVYLHFINLTAHII